MRILVAMFALCIFSASANAQDCLHGSTETAEQEARRRTALQLVRQINTAQMSVGLQKAKRFLPLEELGVDVSKAVGFTPKLTTDGKTYALLLKDTTDPCSFTYMTTDEGLILFGRLIQ